MTFSTSQKKPLARLFAVQAIFQMEASGQNLNNTKTEFEKYKFLSFCSDDDGKLKSRGIIKFTTDSKKLNSFLKNNKTFYGTKPYKIFLD